MVKVRVPATSGNLGPGFDTLGMAFNLYNFVTMEVIPAGFEITVEGEGKDEIPRGKENIVCQAIEKVFKKNGFFPKGLKIHLENHIPVARGLGSSAAVIAGGMAAANFISGEKFDREEILQMAVELEGHPDNIAPALLGGIVISAPEAGKVRYMKIEPPKGLSAVAAVPEFQLPTKNAREVVPKLIPLDDAVFNIGRTSLMIAAIMKKDLALFGAMMEDRLHQSYRAPLVPGMDDVFAAAKEAGAISVALSGAGPTIIAFITEDELKTAHAMEKAFSAHGVKCKTISLQPDNKGVEIVRDSLYNGQ